MKNNKRFLERFIARDKRGRPWMDVSDKVLTRIVLGEKKKRYCPPHRIPHTVPFIGKKVCDEECHIHKSLLRDMHHTLFVKS